LHDFTAKEFNFNISIYYLVIQNNDSCFRPISISLLESPRCISISMRVLKNTRNRVSSRMEYFLNFSVYTRRNI